MKIQPPSEPVRVPSSLPLTPPATAHSPLQPSVVPRDSGVPPLPPQGRSLPVQPFEPGVEHETMVRELVQKRLQIPESPWFSEEGSCMDISALWLQDLKARGIPARMALTDTHGHHSFVQLKDGSRPFQDKFHAFIVIDTPAGELLLDPTWKQFMADKAAVRHQPSILIGRPVDFQAVYQQEHAQLQFETHGYDPRQGQYEPQSATELLYSLGAWRRLRQELD